MTIVNFDGIVVAPVSPFDLQRIESLRDVVYRRTRARRVRTRADAARWIDSVGLCLLFASTQNLELPSLFEAVKGRRDARIDDWDADADRIWEWKNDLPATRRAYYGKALPNGKPIFIARALLPAWLALTMPEDVEAAYRRGQMSALAKRAHDALRDTGPLPTMALRARAGLTREPRYHHALDELQRALVIAPVGAMVERGAWPSQIFDLTARWFPRQVARARLLEVERARRALVLRYLRTVIATTPAMLARVFGWSRATVEATLSACHHIRRQGEWIFYDDR